MINAVTKPTIQELFQAYANYYFKVPKYQREYTWSNKSWDALFDDLTENSKGYFIGFIICINTGDAINPVMEVIDGQQRLTTLTLLMLAIYRQMEEYSDGSNKDLVKLQQRLSNDYSPNGCIIVPQSQNFNDEDYATIMFENHIIDTPSARKPFFHLRKIYRCFDWFTHLLKDEYKDLTDKINSLDKDDEQIPALKEEILLRLKDIKSKVETAMIVKIEVDSVSDAFVLFESLNNRGVPLTAIDLMKNLIMSQAEKAGLTVDGCYKNWESLLAYLSDDYRVQERFFRQYYNAFRKQLNESFGKNDKKEYYLGLLATKSNLLDIYEKIIKKDLGAFLVNILECGKIYQNFIDPETKDMMYPNLKDLLLDLNHSQATTSFMLLMYILRFKDELKIDDNQIKKLIKLLVKFFVRRNMTDYPSTRESARIFMEVIEEIEKNNYTGSDLYNYIYNKLVSVSADDKMFEETLRGDVYKQNIDMTRYILCALAEKDMDKEKWTNLWTRDDNGKLVWTIEHIFPEGQNIPDCWVDMIAGGDSTLAKQYLENYVHNIGNLTITGYNSSLSNLSFIEKRERTYKPKDKDKNVVIAGYKNSLSINYEIAKKDSWTIADIQQRTDTLVKEILDMYRL